MNDKFYEQKKEKQDLMINGAMEVFAKNGYRHASTDEMVKVCGVSKGLWFHYFDNKMGIYSFVVGYAVKYAVLEMSIKIDDAKHDVYDMLKNIEAVKISLMEKYPYLPLLLISIFEEEDEDAILEIKDAKAQYLEQIERLYALCNVDLLNSDTDFEKLKYMVNATFTRMMEEYYKEPIFRKDNYLEKIDGFIQMLKKITYE